MAEEPDKRRQRRQRVLKGAAIINGINNSEISCTIKNQNSGGAELTVPVEAMVPERFVLYVPTDGVAYQSVLRWRRNDRIGVQFTGTLPKPRLHYG
ncbi:PilZ domain-containing protein [Mesorhizobium sp. RCC_202]|uniref:PilZ domain-containing protein n=1 Tax=Mesorhizobium sp. RCC_202 TaxID=3239222 RepID=UPI0035267ACB